MPSAPGRRRAAAQPPTGGGWGGGRGDTDNPRPFRRWLARGARWSRVVRGILSYFHITGRWGYREGGFRDRKRHSLRPSQVEPPPPTRRDLERSKPGLQRIPRSPSPRTTGAPDRIAVTNGGSDVVWPIEVAPPPSLCLSMVGVDPLHSSLQEPDRIAVINAPDVPRFVYDASRRARGGRPRRNFVRRGAVGSRSPRFRLRLVNKWPDERLPVASLDPGATW